MDYLILKGLPQVALKLSWFAVPRTAMTSSGLALASATFYSITTLMGYDNFVATGLIQTANNVCLQGYSLLVGASIMSKKSLNYALDTSTAALDDIRKF